MVIVTGSAGFIGYQVAKALEKQGQEVIGVDEPVFFNSRAEHQDLSLKQIYSPEVILDEGFFQEQIDAGNQITGIIHMGACSDTTEMRVDYLTRVNLNYSQTLWQICTKFKIPFVYASSAATYGGGEMGYQDDETKFKDLKPLNPYGESKRLFDLWVLEQEKLGQTPPAWSGFKFFNVYGFGERHKGKMSSVVLQGFDQIRAHGTLKLFKSHREGILDGEQKRDFIYIADVVNVLIFALTKPILRGIYNLGSGQARSFRDLAVATFKALGMETKIQFIDTPIEIRDRYQYFTEATMDKLKLAGYPNPMTSLEAGVQATIHELKFDPLNLFPKVTPETVPYIEEKAHSKLVDDFLGYQIDEVELRLIHKIQGLENRAEQWIGLAPESLQTPYTEIRRMLESVDLKPEEKVVDLGAGYGRMGFVLNSFFPDSEFMGVEISKLRVEEGNRIYQRHELPETIRLVNGDLADEDFKLPEARVYFLYDLSIRTTIQKVIDQLKEISKKRAITVIGRGRATRDQIERGEPWLSQVVPPIHCGNFSVYSSSHILKN